MFRKKDDDLMHLQQELMAAEDDEEEYEEEYEEEDFEEYSEEMTDDEQEDEDPDSEEEDQEAFSYNQKENTTFASSYGRGKPKKFETIDFFDESDFDDQDVLLKKDYQKAKQKQRRKTMGLVILAVVELIAIAAITIWWSTWAL